MAGCPSELKLELFIAQGAPPQLAAHVGSCRSCQTRVEEMRRLGREFRCEIYPATVDAVVEAASRHRLLRWLPFLLPAPVAAAAAAIILLAIPQGPPSDYVGLKGDALAIAVYAQGAEGSRALADGEGVPPRSALRFFVHPCRPCRLWLVSVDAIGQVSRLYPAQGEGGAEVSVDGTLPGGAVLDGLPGPERIYALCAQGPLPYADVERAVRVAAAGGEQGVRAARKLTGLPAGVDEATLLIEKRP
jgi:hypothetical protein